MKTLRIALVGSLLAAMLAGGPAYAQAPPDLAAGEYGAVTQLQAQHVTPLATIGDLSVGIWAPVSPPYDVTANRNGTANPLP